MSAYVINYSGGRKMMRRVETEQEYMALRDSQDNLRAEKKHMVQMNYSCLPCPDGKLAGSKTPSDSVGMDIDFDPTVEGWEAERTRTEESVMEKQQELGLLMLERSAGKGLHVVFRRHAEMTQEENLQWASRLLGVEFDKGAKDITRVFFTPPSAGHLLFLDPELFTQNEAETEQMPVAEAMTKRTGVIIEKSAPEVEASTETSVQSADESSPLGDGDLTYEDIPYADIIREWWRLYNHGKQPVRSNRNTLTFELAVNLRHICGFDRGLLGRVIPCYDGFPEAEKMACIDSALNEKPTQMPSRLKKVLACLTRTHPCTAEGASACGEDDTEAGNAAKLCPSLPSLPQGIRDSVDAVGPSLALPVIMAVCPAIGALATGVRLDIHGKMSGLNLISYIAGDFASGKGSIDPVVAAWTHEMRAQDKGYFAREAEWRRLKRAAKNKKDQPEEPHCPVRCLTFNNTVANIAERLSRTQGKHAFSFTPEADTLAQNWRTGMNDFSVMLRQAYDGTAYAREAKSVDAVSVHIDHLLWNVVMCGTPDALYRVVTNYTDGFQSRIAIARTPDNTFTPLSDNLYTLKPSHIQNISSISHLLPLMEGEVTLRRLEKRGRDWLEAVRLETMENADSTKARQRFRICPTSMRMTVCILLCRVAQRLIKQYGLEGAEAQLRQHPSLWQQMLQEMPSKEFAIFNILADYMMECALHFFRDRIEAQTVSSDHSGGAASRSRRSKNDTIFSRLQPQFTFAEAYEQVAKEKGAKVNNNLVFQILKNWRRQNLIARKGDDGYVKTCGGVA